METICLFFCKLVNRLSLTYPPTLATPKPTETHVIKVWGILYFLSNVKLLIIYVARTILSWFVNW